LALININRDAFAVNRGFYFHYLSTLSKWIAENFSGKVDAIFIELGLSSNLYLILNRKWKCLAIMRISKITLLMRRYLTINSPSDLSSLNEKILLSVKG